MTVLSLNNRPKDAEDLYYKGRFFQRKVLNKNVVYFARREIQRFTNGLHTSFSLKILQISLKNISAGVSF